MPNYYLGNLPMPEPIVEYIAELIMRGEPIAIYDRETNELRITIPTERAIAFDNDKRG